VNDRTPWKQLALEACDCEALIASAGATPARLARLRGVLGRIAEAAGAALGPDEADQAEAPDDAEPTPGPAAESPPPGDPHAELARKYANLWREPALLCREDDPKRDARSRSPFVTPKSMATPWELSHGEEFSPEVEPDVSAEPQP